MTQTQTEAPVDDAQDGVGIQEAELDEAAEQIVAGGGGQIDILLDTAMSVQVRLGDAEVPVRDLLELAPGSVLALDRAVGEPVDVYLRGIRFATAKIVVVDDRIGVRIEEILDGAEGDDAPDENADGEG